MSERWAIYMRADSLFDTSNEIGRQFKFCQAHLSRSGWTLAGACVDFGSASKRTDTRGGFQSLLDEAEQGCFDILLICDTSHISTNARALRSFVGQLAAANVRVCEVSPSKNASHHAAKIIERTHDNAQNI